MWISCGSRARLARRCPATDRRVSLPLREASSGSQAPAAPYARAMPSFAQSERQQLVALLSSLGPGERTLCEGWQTGDLAAHLVLRDHRPDAAPGMVTKRYPFGPYTERLQRRLKESTPWDVLLERLRDGPPALLRPLDEQLNCVEFFVHHEDVRRAQPNWQRRELASEDEAALWRRARVLGRLARQRPARLEAPGRQPLVLGRDGPTVIGNPAELVIWLTGREAAALVEVH